RDFRDLIDDGEVDVVDICTPPSLHAAMIVDAVRAGKHVICEKPFAGYFGRAEDKTPIGHKVPKSLMYERVMEEMERTCAAIKSSGQLFMYAEDWIYAPAVTKSVEILNSTKDKVLFMKAEESHSGSHAAHAAQWAMTGGGSLITHGMPSVVHRPLSEAGGCPCARRTDCGVFGHRRYRKCRREPAAAGPRLYQEQSARRRRCGHADADSI